MLDIGAPLVMDVRAVSMPVSYQQMEDARVLVLSFSCVRAMRRWYRCRAYHLCDASNSPRVPLILRHPFEKPIGGAGTAVKLQPQDIDLLTPVIGRRIKLRGALQVLRSRKLPLATAAPRPSSALALSNSNVNGNTRPGLDFTALLQGKLM